MLVRRLYESVYGPPQGRAPIRTSLLARIGRYVLPCAVAGFLGWTYGERTAERLEGADEKVTPFESEDQLFAMADAGRPVFHYYYVPGEIRSREFRKTFVRSALKNSDVMEHVAINCAKHFDVCRNKSLSYFPYILLLLPRATITDPTGNTSYEYPTVEFRKDFSLDGVRAFMEENGLRSRVDRLNRLTATVRKSLS